MRLQLISGNAVRTLACSLLLVVAAAATARADGEVILRGNYWRDTNTRVLAPEAVVRKTTPTGTTIEANYLLDAITSASAASGVAADQAFTELRSEAGFKLRQEIGPVSLQGRYRYSSESDYWAHSAGGGVLFDLLQKNLSIGLNYNYTHGQAARRVNAVGYVPAGSDRSTLETHYFSLSAAQVLARWALLSGGVEVRYEDGFQANPYRFVVVSGSPIREVDPYTRLRVTASATVRMTPIYKRGVVDHLTLFVGYRLHDDTWGVLAHTPELRAHLGLGPIELRLTGRYYTQSAATFYRSQGGKAAYDQEVTFKDCPPPTGQCATGDSKLSAFDSVFLDGRVVLELRTLLRGPSGLSRWLAGSAVGVSLGRYWNSGFAHLQFGDAWVGGLDLLLPL